MPLGLVALVGAPNVGKSTIFNRLLGERASIVEDTPGVTRDRLYGTAEWLTRKFRLVDTGGIEVANAPFQTEIRAQVQIAIDEADVIIFVVDGKMGLSDDDKAVAKMLYKSKKPIILAVNKIDNLDRLADASEFYALGLGDPIAVSGSHGIGIGDLLDKVISLLPKKEEEEYPGAIPFCFIGRPNVGKSSLTNAVLGQNRVIVNSLAGTTRDSIDTPFTSGEDNYVAIDTAGLVKRGRIYESIDKYAALRALRAIDRSQVAVLVIDAEKGILDQDRHVAGYAIEANKSMVIAVNKWDMAPKGLMQQQFEQEIRTRFKFLSYAKVIFLSAKTGKGIEKLLPAVKEAYVSGTRRIPTSVLNQIVSQAQQLNPTPEFNHGRLKIVYSSQVSINPPTFVFFCNDPRFAHFSYTRYLENTLRDSFDFTGSPLHIIYRQRK
ncbi:MAG TPA: ribosome biogenesis GTPase Der [Candidatus Enteromonas pullicola]|uniref:GTPase Der n=1 Tax=Candidatus Alloenteromonas pullicola TaxID=2840784 RepID=A0A9D1LMS6_9FIRM|nr:ribosome biogenesis GTPase Der [Candidatus Enteromonas pullicola]